MTILFHCPRCKGTSLAIRTKVWVNWPERAFDDDDQMNQQFEDHAICRSRGCGHFFKLMEALVSDAPDTVSVFPNAPLSEADPS
jgi:hypothetical protein